jgi:hypothetical protein
MQAHAAFASANGFTKTYRCRSVACHKPEMEAGGKSMLCFFLIGVCLLSKHCFQIDQ